MEGYERQFVFHLHGTCLDRIAKINVNKNALNHPKFFIVLVCSNAPHHQLFFHKRYISHTKSGIVIFCFHSTNGNRLLTKQSENGQQSSLYIWTSSTTSTSTSTSTTMRCSSSPWNSFTNFAGKILQEPRAKVVNGGRIRMWILSQHPWDLFAVRIRHISPFQLVLVLPPPQHIRTCIRGISKIVNLVLSCKFLD